MAALTILVYIYMRTFIIGDAENGQVFVLRMSEFCVDDTPIFMSVCLNRSRSRTEGNARITLAPVERETTTQPPLLGEYVADG